jgi:hypothetical protein
VLEITEREGRRLSAFNAATALHRVARHAAADAKSSLGDAKSSLGDAKSSLGDAKSSASLKHTLRHDARFRRLLRIVRASLASLQPQVRSPRKLNSLSHGLGPEVGNLNFARCFPIHVLPSLTVRSLPAAGAGERGVGSGSAAGEFGR